MKLLKKREYYNVYYCNCEKEEIEVDDLIFYDAVKQEVVCLVDTIRLSLVYSAIVFESVSTPIRKIKEKFDGSAFYIRKHKDYVSQSCPRGTLYIPINLISWKFIGSNANYKQIHNTYNFGDKNGKFQYQYESYVASLNNKSRGIYYQLVDSKLGYKETLKEIDSYIESIKNLRNQYEKALKVEEMVLDSLSPSTEYTKEMVDKLIEEAYISLEQSKNIKEV